MEDQLLIQFKESYNLRKKFLEIDFIEPCDCLECKDADLFSTDLKFKGVDDFFFGIDHYDFTISYYRSTKVNRPYHSGYSISLEDILESVPPDIQTGILFHLDLFRGRYDLRQ